MRHLTISRSCVPLGTINLDKHCEAALTPDEGVELETYCQLNHLIIRLQARAFCGQPLLNPRPQSADHAMPPHS